MFLTILVGIVGLAAGAYANIKLSEVIENAFEIGISNTYGIGLLLLCWIPLMIAACAFGFTSSIAWGVGPLWALFAPFIAGAMVHALFVVYFLLYKLVKGTPQ